MSQNNAFALNNGESTPVAITFDPITNDNLLATYRKSGTAETVALKPSVSVSLRPAKVTSAGEQKRRVIIKTRVPYQGAAVDGVTPAIKYVESNQTMMIPEDAPIASIDDLIAFSANSLAEAIISDVIDSGAFPY